MLDLNAIRAELLRLPYAVTGTSDPWIYVLSSNVQYVSLLGMQRAIDTALEKHNAMAIVIEKGTSPETRLKIEIIDAE